MQQQQRFCFLRFGRRCGRIGVGGEIVGGDGVDGNVFVIVVVVVVVSLGFCRWLGL